MLTEQFKSDNALLQNSLAYFGLFSVKLGASDLNGPIFPAVSELAAAMLHLTLDTSPPAAQAVAARLDGLATQTFPPVTPTRCRRCWRMDGCCMICCR